MELNDNSFKNDLDDLSWFYYGYTMAKNDATTKSNPSDLAFSYLVILLIVVITFLWFAIGSISFCVILGLIGIVGAWKICYGNLLQSESQESCEERKFKWKKKKGA